MEFKEWNLQNYPSLFEEEALFADYIGENQSEYSIKKHKNGHKLVVNGETFPCYQEFLASKTDYQIPQVKLGKRTRRHSMPEKVEALATSSSLRSSSVRRSLKVSLNGVTERSKTNIENNGLKMSLNGVTERRSETNIENNESKETEKSETSKDNKFFKEDEVSKKKFIETSLRHFAWSLSKKSGAARMQVQKELELIRKNWGSTRYDKELICHLLKVQWKGDFKLSPFSRLKSSAYSISCDAVEFKHLSYFKFDSNKNYELKLAILMEVQNIHKSVCHFSSFSKIELEQHLASIIYDKLLMKKDHQLLKKAGLQAACCFVDELIFEVKEGVKLKYFKLPIYTISEEGFVLSNQGIGLENMR